MHIHERLKYAEKLYDLMHPHRNFHNSSRYWELLEVTDRFVDYLNQEQEKENEKRS